MDKIDSLIKKADAGLSLPERQRLKEQLAEHINDLILHDFPALVQLLYRIDIQESKLKLLLKENKQTDASKIISDLIIERQLQKLKTKRSQNPSDNINDEEKW